jgi:hypothetical protein
VANKTLEIEAIKMIDNKRDIIEAVVDGKYTPDKDQDLLGLVLQKIRDLYKK